MALINLMGTWNLEPGTSSEGKSEQWAGGTSAIRLAGIYENDMLT